MGPYLATIQQGTAKAIQEKWDHLFEHSRSQLRWGVCGRDGDHCLRQDGACVIPAGHSTLLTLPCQYHGGGQLAQT